MLSPELLKMLAVINNRIESKIVQHMAGREYVTFIYDYKYTLSDNCNGCGSTSVIIYEEQNCFVGWNPVRDYLLTAPDRDMLIDKIMLWEAQSNLNQSLSYKKWQAKFHPDELIRRNMNPIDYLE